MAPEPLPWPIGPHYLLHLHGGCPPCEGISAAARFWPPSRPSKWPLSAMKIIYRRRVGGGRDRSTSVAHDPSGSGQCMCIGLKDRGSKTTDTRRFPDHINTARTPRNKVSRGCEGGTNGFADVRDCWHPLPVTTKKRLGHSARPRRLKSRHLYGHQVGAIQIRPNLAAA